MGYPPKLLTNRRAEDYRSWVESISAPGLSSIHRQLSLFQQAPTQSSPSRTARRAEDYLLRFKAVTKEGCILESCFAFAGNHTNLPLKAARFGCLNLIIAWKKEKNNSKICFFKDLAFILHAPVATFARSAVLRVVVGCGAPFLDLEARGHPSDVLNFVRTAAATRVGCGAFPLGRGLSATKSANVNCTEIEGTC